MTERYEEAVDRFKAIEAECAERKAKRDSMKAFMVMMKKSGEAVVEFSEMLWIAMVESVVIQKDRSAVFTFRNGTTIEAK